MERRRPQARTRPNVGAAGLARNPGWAFPGRHYIQRHRQQLRRNRAQFASQLCQVAEACGLKGVTARTQAELTEALRQSCEAQKKGVTTFIEVILNQELGEPFRRDAMKKPTVVAGIRREDMRAQEVAWRGLR